MYYGIPGFGIAIAIVVLILINSIKILKEYERGVIFTLGRVDEATGIKGPGIVIVLPLVQKIVRISLRTVTMDVPSQDIITKDNVTVKVNAVVYFRVIDPRKAIIEVEDFYYATSLISQTTLRSVLGQNALDDLLSNREAINAELQKVIDLQTEPWGVKVTTVEVSEFQCPFCNRFHNASSVSCRHFPSNDANSSTMLHALLGSSQDSSSLMSAARASGIPWVIVGYHFPCLTAGNYQCGSGPALMNLLVSKHVDLVLHGHEHSYQRGKQLALDPATCASIADTGYNPACVVDDGMDGVYPRGAGTVDVIAGTFGRGTYNVSRIDPEGPYFTKMDGASGRS